VVGAFFVALLIFDMAQKNYGDLPYHAISGVILTGLFWLICSLVSVSVSAAILVVPAIFICTFLFTIWFTGESMKQRGCCINCDGESSIKKLRFVKRDNPLNISAISTSAPAPASCRSTLTATTVG
jgi:hypothetical protein